MMNEILDLMEVYRVARRIYIGAKSFGSMDDQRVVDAIKETEESWTDFMAFLSMAAMEVNRLFQIFLFLFLGKNSEI
jgi:hypothetical protein